MVPIFKKGRKDDVGNYRPVSLTSLVCKVLERIIKDHIQDHLDRYGLINDSQHGFSKGRSCLTNMLEFLDYATKEVDNGKPVDIIYLDFSKAFHKVPHMRLTLQLAQHGIKGRVGNWVKEWLTGRKQRVF